MSDQDWRSVISEDGQSAVISIPQGQREEATIVFNDVADLDRLIHMVSVVRAQMRPRVPTSLNGLDVSLTNDTPVWAALGTRKDGKRPLLLRHPGLGWIGFLFDDDTAALLAASMTAELET